MYSTIYKSKLFSSGYGGQIIAYDIKTGQVLWNYNATAPGFESPYGYSRMPLIPPLCADDKIYVASSEHSPPFPLSRGRYIHCLDDRHWGTTLEAVFPRRLILSCKYPQHRRWLPNWTQQLRRTNLLHRQRS